MKFSHRAALGVTVVALIACGASASAAQAAFKWTVPTAPASLTGTQNTVHAFNFKAGRFKCNTAKLSATMSTTAAEKVTFTPSYEACTLFGSSAKIETNGCHYVMRATSLTAVDEYAGGLQIECPAGKSMVVTQTGLAGCEVMIPGQIEHSGVTFKDETTAGDVVVKFNVGIEYTQTAACGATEPFTNEYEGTSTIKAASGTLKIQ